MAVFVEMNLEINKDEIKNIKKYIHLHGGTRINIQKINDRELSWLSWDQEDEIYYDSENNEQIDYISKLCSAFVENNYATQESIIKMIENNLIYLSEVYYDSMQINLEKDDFKKCEKQLTKSKEREI